MRTSAGRPLPTRIASQRCNAPRIGIEKRGRNPSVAIAASAGRCDSTHCDRPHLSARAWHAIPTRYINVCRAVPLATARAHTRPRTALHAWGGAASPGRGRRAHSAAPLERTRAPRRPPLRYACDARPCVGPRVGFSRTASVGWSCDAAASSSGRRPALSGASSSGCASLRAAHIASTHACSPSSAAMCAAVVPVLQQQRSRGERALRCAAPHWAINRCDAAARLS